MLTTRIPSQALARGAALLNQRQSIRAYRNANGVVIRPRRSVLYVSGGNERAIQHTNSASRFIILDLEDTVAPEHKERARRQVCTLLETKAFGKREVVVRLNAFDSPWFADDISIVLDAAPHAILVSKIASPDTLRAVEHLISSNNNASVFTRLWAMIETPRAVLHGDAIAAATTRLSVSWLHATFAGLRARTTKPQQPAATLSMVVLAARAHVDLSTRATSATQSDVRDDAADDKQFGPVCAGGAARVRQQGRGVRATRTRLCSFRVCVYTAVVALLLLAFVFGR